MSQCSDKIDQICNLLSGILEETQAQGFVVGVSGGVDSAVVASLCCRAVGERKVRGIFMPSSVTPQADGEDVSALGRVLNLNIATFPIAPFIDQYRQLPGFVETPYLMGNLMARTRMTILYYAANQDQALVCGTSNRTEYLLGYCTKHGDNAADIQPIVHLLKSEVWEIARFLHVPESIISRPPSAGLWQGQTDEGELGLAYVDIDAAIRSLDIHGWKPETEIEKQVVARHHSAKHKQVPAYSLPVQR